MQPTTKAGQQFEQHIEILTALPDKNGQASLEDMEKIWDGLKKRPKN
jgi:hypothetical protein